MTGSGPWRAPPAQAAGRPPDDVHAAWVLWLAATGFALIGMLLNSATARFADLPVATRDGPQNDPPRASGSTRARTSDQAPCSLD